MLGMVFNALKTMLEEKVSADYAEEVFTAAKLEHDGHYEDKQTYPDSELGKILDVLAKETDHSLDSLMYDFGYFWFGHLVHSHGQMLAGREGLLELLEALDDDVHKEVKKLYPNASVPDFEVMSRTEHGMRLRYHSPRDLVSLAEGMLDAGAAHFNQNLSRETLPTGTPHTYEFSLTIE